MKNDLTSMRPARARMKAAESVRETVRDVVREAMPAVEVAPPQPSAWNSSGFAAANTSIKRGEVWWPDLDTRMELDAFSRNEILRRIRWLYANVGRVRRIVRGLAEMIGTLTPQAVSSDEDWNTLAENSFMAKMGAPNVFDVAGKLNFWTAQLQLNRSR